VFQNVVESLHPLFNNFSNQNVVEFCCFCTQNV
jgi:hypothetical protein